MTCAGFPFIKTQILCFTKDYTKMKQADENSVSFHLKLQKKVLGYTYNS